MAENKRGRNWTMVIYPESAPEDWRSILDDLHVSWIESPLHDKDVNADGEKKKAHWHILIIFEGNKSYKQVKEIADDLNTPIPQRVESARGMVRYMIHLDNPEKYQYSQDEIVGHGGADVNHYFEMTVTNRLSVLKDIIQYIHEHHVTNFMDLLMYALQNNDEWFTVIADKNTLVVNKAIDAEWHYDRKK